MTNLEFMSKPPIQENKLRLHTNCMLAAWVSPDAVGMDDWQGS